MRSVGWYQRLEASIERARSVGWGWSNATCLDMMIDAAAAVCERDVRSVAIDVVGGRPRLGRRGRLRDLAELGGVMGAVEVVANACGFPEIEPWQASAGDWAVAYHMGNAEAVSQMEGVVRGSGCWIFRLPKIGVTSLPDEVAGGVIARVWAVG